MTDPYTPPTAPIVDIEASQRHRRGPLIWIPVTVCVAHFSLGVLVLVVLVLFDTGRGFVERSQFLLHPYLVAQPVCTLLAAYRLQLAKRDALWPLLALLLLIALQSERVGTTLPMAYFLPAALLAAYVLLLAVFRKLR